MEFTAGDITQIIIALLGLIGIIIQTIVIWRQSRKIREGSKSIEKIEGKREANTSKIKRKDIYYFVLFLLVFIYGLYGTKKFIHSDNTSQSVIYLTRAEDALNEEQYLNAIKYADKCIISNEKQALQIQHRLDSLNISVIIGAVSDEKQKNEIFSHGLLNDVAAASFYKGKAAEELYKMDTIKNSKYKQIAIDSYKLTLKLDKGRRWDPRDGGFFWSPNEGAQEQMGELEK